MKGTPVKVLSVCTSDSYGGAARAAYRIHLSQRNSNISSRMLVKYKSVDDPSVYALDSFLPHNALYKSLQWITAKIENKMQQSRWMPYTQREDVFMSDLRGCDLHSVLKRIDYDILHLHWINQRFIPISQLPKDKPIIWTLHDSWPFCGICHYFLECNRYTTHCGQCPFLHSTNENDLSHKIWKKKLRVYKDLDLHIVTPSQWLGDCAKRSVLLGRFPMKVIPNCLDSDIFRPLEESELSPRWRTLINRTNGKRIILFGAINATRDKIKGYSQLISSIQYLEQRMDTNNIAIVVFGANSSDMDIQTAIPIHYVGYINNNDDLVSLYNIADVMIVPSLTEVFAQTASEALSCGVPTVAFRCTGIQETINHKINGYTAEPFDPADFATGILWCLNNNDNNKLGKAGREKALKNYSSAVVGKQYEQLYLSVYNESR